MQKEKLTHNFFSKFKLGDAGFIDNINGDGSGDIVITGWSCCLEETIPDVPDYLLLVYGDKIIAKVDAFNQTRQDVHAALPQVPENCGFSVRIQTKRCGTPFDPLQLEAFAVSHSGFMFQLHKEQKHCFLLQLEPTGLCNLRCPQCPNTIYSGFNNKDISIEDIALVEPLIHKASTICYDGFGEFFMSKNIWEALAITPLKSHVLVHTNGMLAHHHFDQILNNAPPLRQLVFSLDSLQPKRYNIIRKGGDIDKVLYNMRELKLLRDARNQRLPFIVPNMKIMNLNFDELYAFVDLAAELDGFLELIYLYDPVKLAGQEALTGEADFMLSYERQQPRYHAPEVARTLKDALAYGKSRGVVTHFAGAITEAISGEIDENGYMASHRPLYECPMVDCSAALQLDGKFMYCVWQTSPVFDWRKEGTVNATTNARAKAVREMIKNDRIPHECSGACCHFVHRRMSDEQVPQSANNYCGGWQTN